MGIVNLQDGLVTRGVLIDMPGKAMRRQDIEAWEAETGITISAGDALFLRTGRDVGQTGGYHPSLMPFFKERDIALLGADVPQEGGVVEGVPVPVHFFALVALGVHLFDNLGLEDLARTANELNRWEFMFMASPHVVPNGAGSANQPACRVLAARGESPTAFDRRCIPLSTLLLGRILPVFSLVAPCQTGASPVSVRRWTSTTDC